MGPLKLWLRNDMGNNYDAMLCEKKQTSMNITFTKM